MKKCPLCNRTYSDETLSFCLEDGSLLSAPFDLQAEQETVFRPNITKSAPTEYFPAPAANYNEIPTVVSSKNTNSTSPQAPQAQNRRHLVISGVLFGIFVLLAGYTASAVPLIIGFVITLVYGFAQKFKEKGS
jgi:hypothetical protein